MSEALGLAAYWRNARDAFEATTRDLPLHECRHEIAGLPIRSRFAGEDLLPRLTRALRPGTPAPTADSNSVPALELRVACNTPAHTRLDLPKRHHQEILAQQSGPLAARFESASGALSLWDAATSEAIYWVADPAALPAYEEGFPFRLLLSLWLAPLGIHLVHAAAVGNASGAVLIVGKGGSGKSTTALACLRHGLDYLGDDYVAVSLSPTPRVWNLYVSAKVTDDALARFPALRELTTQATPVGGGKSLVFLGGPHGARIPCSRPLRAVFRPRLTGQVSSRIEPTPPAAALLAAAPSTILQNPTVGSGAFHALAQLVRQVPTCTLEAGTDLDTLTDTIQNWLSRNAP